MNIEQFRDYCLQKTGTEECFPFDASTLVFKVAGKMFALADIESSPLSISLKCDPEVAGELRSRYTCVSPGYHMNKRHWNTIIIDGSVDTATLKEWIDHSYDSVVSKLSKSAKALVFKG